MKQTIFILFICSIFSISSLSQTRNNEQVFGSYKEMVTAAKQEIQLISIDEFHKIYTKVLSYGGTDFTLIDIRTESEFTEGSIPGAFLVQRGTLESSLEKDEVWKAYNYDRPEKTDTIILYCRSGGRSALASKSLKMLGYTDVKSLEGGWQDWNQKYPNLKIVK